MTYSSESGGVINESELRIECAVMAYSSESGGVINESKRKGGW